MSPAFPRQPFPDLVEPKVRRQQFFFYVLIHVRYFVHARTPLEKKRLPFFFVRRFPRFGFNLRHRAGSQVPRFYHHLISGLQQLVQLQPPLRCRPSPVKRRPLLMLQIPPLVLPAFPAPGDDRHLPTPLPNKVNPYIPPLFYYHHCSP
jgi:hypothetical protein